MMTRFYGFAKHTCVIEQIHQTFHIAKYSPGQILPGWVQGLQFNILGDVSGVDFRRPTLKLPGFGRIGLATA